MSKLWFSYYAIFVGNWAMFSFLSFFPCVCVCVCNPEVQVKFKGNINCHVYKCVTGGYGERAGESDLMVHMG
jgi:hypothetical protein